MVDAGGTTVTTILDTFTTSTGTPKGFIRIVAVGDPTRWILWKYTSTASPTGYRNLTVVPIASSATSPFANLDPIVLSFEGASGPTVLQSTQYLGFGSAPPTAGNAEQIRADGNLFSFTNGNYRTDASGTWTGLGRSGQVTLQALSGTLRLEASVDLVMVGNATYNANAATGAIVVTAAGTATLQSTAGAAAITAGTNITETAGGFINLIPGSFVAISGSNAFLRMTEEAASTPTVGAGNGLYWIKTDHNPYFTDSSDVDHRIVLAPVLITDLAVETSNVAPSFAVHVSFAAGATGARDVTVFNANAPVAFRILQTTMIVKTAVALSSATLRDATGGGGTAISAQFATSIAGEDPIKTATLTATPTVAANGTVVLRLTDGGVAGEVMLNCIRT